MYIRTWNNPALRRENPQLSSSSGRLSVLFLHYSASSRYLVSLSSLDSAFSLSRLRCRSVCYCSTDWASRLALSLILLLLNPSSPCSAVSDARRALSLSLLLWSLPTLFTSAESAEATLISLLELMVKNEANSNAKNKYSRISLSRLLWSLLTLRFSWFSGDYTDIISRIYGTKMKPIAMQRTSIVVWTETTTIVSSGYVYLYSHS